MPGLDFFFCRRGDRERRRKREGVGRERARK